MFKQIQCFRRMCVFLWVVILSLPLFAYSLSANAGPLPLTLGASNVTDVLSNVQGGLRRGTRVLNKLDVTAQLSGDETRLSGWSGFMDLQWTDATRFSETLVGDMQGVSNIDAPSNLRLLNAWIGYNGEALGGKAGILDLNSEFDIQATGALFLNSAHGIGPDFSQSGENGPSIFPSTGLGAVGRWLPRSDWQVKAGIFEGVAGDPAHPGRTSVSLTAREGALLVFEARKQVTANFTLGGGAWTYTAAFPTLDGGMTTGNAGFYAIADAKLYGKDGTDENGFRGWLRVGFANARINPIDMYIGGGLVYTGVLTDDDQAGFSVASSHLGGPAQRAAALASQTLTRETTLEATYSLALGNRLILQPDIQYVLSPGGDASVDNALVVGSRITLTWN